MSAHLITPKLEKKPSLRCALAWAARHFSPVITDTPRLDAELLLAHCLGWNRARVYTYPEETLAADQQRHFETLVRRHSLGEPLAYILGRQEFFGLDFFVDNRVLIPRPETELLVEEAIAWLQVRESNRQHLTVADIGTGSGAIAISLAMACPRLNIYALDTSAGALQVAARNTEHHGLTDQVKLLHGDLLEPLPEKADLIAANLPYVSEAEMAQLPPHIARFEPRLALAGGLDGLAVIERLLSLAQNHLQPAGLILLEIGIAQGEQALNRARRYFPSAQIDVRQDYASRDRLVIIQT